MSLIFAPASLLPKEIGDDIVEFFDEEEEVEVMRQLKTDVEQLKTDVKQLKTDVDTVRDKIGGSCVPYGPPFTGYF